jgi:hypothetical protein
MSPKNSIGKENAIKLYNSNWWEGLSYQDIAKFQLFIQELCCPFKVFYEAVEKSLGRSVYAHEFALNYSGICREFLGEFQQPTFEEILNLLPEDKRIVLKANLNEN